MYPLPSAIRLVRLQAPEGAHDMALYTAAAKAARVARPEGPRRHGGGQTNRALALWDHIHEIRTRGPERAPPLTVGYRAIEIDSQEAVSRFLNVHGKSGGQLVNF